jgi:putative tributyrin esterase
MLTGLIPARCRCVTSLNKEFIPEMYKRYDLNPETTFIDGLSMGGHGAINVFIDNYDKFKAAGSLSGVLRFAACL